MIDRPRFDAALSLLRAEMEAAPPAEREEVIGDLIALAGLLLVDRCGLDAAVARLHREADELAADFAVPEPSEVN